MSSPLYQAVEGKNAIATQTPTPREAVRTVGLRDVESWVFVVVKETVDARCRHRSRNQKRRGRVATSVLSDACVEACLDG